MSDHADFLPFAKPSFGIEEEEAVLEVLRSGWLTSGRIALAFEAEFARYVGVKHALAVNSATSGLHLALEASRVGPGDSVITSPYTFASTAAVARHLGAEIVFCDVEKNSYNMDPDCLKKTLATAKNCRAVIPVHLGGLPCRIAEINDLSHAYGCSVIEDSAHAFPSRLPGGFAGTLGDIGVYSFYATKTITTGEGGMIVTQDERLKKRMSTMRMHGIDREVWDRYTSKGSSWSYSVVEAGYKYNLPDILAAIGRVQLKKAASFLEQRESISRRYSGAFGSRDYLELPPDGEGHSWHLYTIRIHADRLSINRDKYIELLSERGIGTSVHFIPLHIMPYWSSRYGLKGEDFPEALNSYERSISLPIYPGMTEQQVSRVIANVTAVGDAARVSSPERS